MTELPPLIGFVRGCAGDLMMLRRARDRGKAIPCPSCGSTVVVRQDAVFGRAEWDRCNNHVYLREALELLGVTVPRRTRRLAAAALARIMTSPHAPSVLWEAVIHAEKDADCGEPLPEREELWSRLLEFYGDGFPIDIEECLAEACAERDPEIHPQGLGQEGWELLCDVWRDLIPNPFVPTEWRPEWFTSTVRDLAAHIYAERAFDLMPILGDALMDAGCDHSLVQEHCRTEKPHARGCRVVDAILGKA